MILRHASDVLTKSRRLSLVTMTPSVFSARCSRNLCREGRECVMEYECVMGLTGRNGTHLKTRGRGV